MQTFQIPQTVTSVGPDIETVVSRILTAASRSSSNYKPSIKMVWFQYDDWSCSGIERTSVRQSNHLSHHHQSKQQAYPYVTVRSFSLITWVWGCRGFPLTITNTDHVIFSSDSAWAVNSKPLSLLSTYGAPKRTKISSQSLQYIKLSKIILVHHNPFEVSLTHGLQANQVYLCSGVEVFRDDRLHYYPFCCNPLTLLLAFNTYVLEEVQRSNGYIGILLGQFVNHLVLSPIARYKVTSFVSFIGLFHGNKINLCLFCLLMSFY